MQEAPLRAFEFDRIVAIVAGLAITPAGRRQMAELRPMTDAPGVQAAQRETSEGVRFLSDYSGFPLRAPADLDRTLEGLAVQGRPLEPLRLLGLADFFESIDRSRTLIAGHRDAFPILDVLVAGLRPFQAEIADVRRKIDPAGEVVDHASAALAGIRDRLRRQRQKLRTTLEGLVRGRDTSKYLQEQVVTDRNGRYVLMVRAEHRSAIPGVVHGASASGASLFLEPLVTVEVNNDIVALEEAEAEEVRRILLALTDAFRLRPDDLQRTIAVATSLDLIQARARFSALVGGIEAVISRDGTFELRGARHPLLMPSVWSRESWDEDGSRPEDGPPAASHGMRPDAPIPVDVLLIPPARVLIIAGPNTGGKTVALKTAGLLAAMAQAGLHIPVEHGSRVPIFQAIYADIGDEQSISASLSTFSAHIANVVSMERGLTLPALILLDEVGAGTDPAEGGALGIAVIDHFRQRGAHLIATTHYDALKSYASTTDGVVGAAFGFTPDTYAPTYRLHYGSPGRSLALEIAARYGMPPAVVAAARENLSDREKQLANHLARIDEDLGRLQQERLQLGRERAEVAETARSLSAREESIREREGALRRRLGTRIDDQLRDARREIDAVIEGLKSRATALTDKGVRRATAGITTGEAGAARADARTAIDTIAARLKTGVPAVEPPATPAPMGPVSVGAKVSVGAFGLEGIVLAIHGPDADVDVHGKRLRAAIADLRVIGSAPSRGQVRINVDLQPREGALTELNVIGCTVDEALARTERFIDESTVTDHQTLRIIHGHGTGQLRRAIGEFLKQHPLVARYQLAPQDQGGGGATIVELKE